MPAKITSSLLSGALLAASLLPAAGQLPQPSATPHSLLLPNRPLGAPAATPNAAPAREVPLVEKKFEQLSDQNISPSGRAALAIDPAKWRHAETENFIIHYRRATEAQKVVREVEYDLWFVAATLGAGRDRYQKKSHVYVFEDEAQWQKFLEITHNPMSWAASYAHGDELFLNVRGGGNSGQGTSFDSHTLAHETTHAVVARLYPGKRWPLWLNEGFAEYMGGASVAARKGQRVQHYERELHSADLPLDTLVKFKSYPKDTAELHALYQSGEKFIRFLMTEGGGKERIRQFIEAVLGGKDAQTAVLEVYGDKFKDWGAFEKKYSKFTK